MPLVAQAFRAANALPRARRIRALHDIFDALLRTASVQVHRGRIAPPAGVPDWWSLPLDKWTTKRIEATYGIGGEEDRKDFLHDALDALLRKTPPVDIEKIYRILAGAKSDLAQWYETENEFDDQRVVETERQVLQPWLDRVQRLQRLDDEALTMSAGPIARALRVKVSKKKIAAPPLRRPRSGAPTFDMRPTLRALAAAGATGWIRTTLLDATGLTVLARSRT
jgi:hypothetical protein